MSIHPRRPRMDVSTSTSGVATMIAGGASLFLALVLLALIEQPFPIATILIAGGILFFMVGAVLYDHRSNQSFQDPRLHILSPDQ
jgi:hypothetical protein